MNSVVDRVFPAARWLSVYQRADFVADLRAGVTVAVLLIPQAMAYAALAGVPAITGLYAAMVSLVVYAAFGTSRFISVGPVAIDALLTAAAVAPLADGDPARYVALTALLTLMVGLIQVSAGLVRLGGLVHMVSVPVIVGFTTAAAVTIGLTQLKDLLGLDDVTRTGSSFLAAARVIAPALDTLEATTTVIGLASVAAILALKRWVPQLPGPLLVVATLSAVVALTDLDLATVGDVPSGLPLPHLPAVDLQDVRALALSAAAIALVSYMESISTGQTFARRTRTRIDPDQELVAVGLANTASGLFRGLPVAGGFSRGAVNVEGGARTQMSGVVAAGFVVLSLLLLTPVLALVPKVALAAVILSAIGSLIDLRGIRSIARVARGDLFALLATATATLVLGPVEGLGIGVAVSLVVFLRNYQQPHMPELGLIPSEHAFRNTRRHRTITDPRLLVVRVDAPMSFVGARQITDHLAGLVADRGEVDFLVLDASPITAIDFTGLELLGQMAEEMEAAGVQLHLAQVRGPVHDKLERAEWFRRLEGAGRVHQDVGRAVAHLPITLDPDPDPGPG